MTIQYILNQQRDFLFTENKRIILEGLPYDGRYCGDFPQYIYYKKFDTLELNKGIPIYYNWDNYWHFLNDVIGQFHVLEKTGFDFNIPIIVPKRILNYKYAQEFLNSSFAKKLNIVFQEENILVRI